MFSVAVYAPAVGACTRALVMLEWHGNTDRGLHLQFYASVGEKQ